MDYIKIDFTYLPKLLWRLFNSIRLRFRHVYISPFARWNGHTTLEQPCLVQSKANVGGSQLGRYSYVNECCWLPHCKIGRFCSIARDVRVVAYRHPTTHFVSTSPAFYSTLKQCGETLVSENKFAEQSLADGHSIIIGNDVWIGEGVRIIEGVRIADGAIVCAGALVASDVPPYAIVGGVPAKVIRFRFPDQQIALLETLQWWNNDEEWLKAHAAAFTDIDTFAAIHQR